MFHYFVWKGVNSRDFDLLCSAPPLIAPAPGGEKISIPGRSGYLYADDGSFASVTKTVECRLLSDERIDALIPWLSGSGEVLFSSEADKFYKAVVNQAVSIGYLLKRYRSFTVSFDCQPFKYAADHKSHVIYLDQSPRTFLGGGSVASEPVITVYGRGDIELAVNGTIIRLAGVEEYITINSEIMDAYKDGVNANRQMTGTFPKLNPSGETNTVSFTGDVAGIEIIPHYRWL